MRAKGDAIISQERLEGLAAAREMLVLGLRTAAGVDLMDIGQRYGVDPQREFGATIGRLEAGRFVRSDGNLRLARRGWRLADAVAAEFL